MKTFVDMDKLLKDNRPQNEFYKVFVPRSLLIQEGTIGGVPTDLTVEELNMEIQSGAM